MKSLRRDLLVGLLSALTLVMLLMGWAIYRSARSELDALLDYHLRQVVLSLEAQDFESILEPLGSNALQDIVIQVWRQDGVELYFSHPHRAVPGQVALGFSTMTTADGEWRVYGEAAHGQVIQAAQPMAVRRRLALASVEKMLLPFLFMLPALAALVWLIVRRNLASLDAIAEEVAQRRPEALEPIRAETAPEEVAPLVVSLNSLLARLGSTLQAQRAFVADAAHELRTPLAALRLQVQLVERARTADERDAATAELKRGLDRATHGVEQLLTLARLEPGVNEKRGAPVSLADLARQTVADFSLLAADKRIDLGLAAEVTETGVEGDADALRTMLRNLVENAVRYTPPGGRVDVAAGVAEGRPYLEVRDNGPGIPLEERERVFDRFYRGRTSEEEGSGLGLAIVQAAARRHRAAVELQDAPGGGLLVRVVFPAEATALSQS